jgi:transposase
VSLLYSWRKKYTPEGEKTQFATMEEENRALKLENAELKIET